MSSLEDAGWYRVGKSGEPQTALKQLFTYNKLQFQAQREHTYMVN